MITGKTNSGFEFFIPEENLDDYELLELVTEVDKGNNAVIMDVIDRLLGKEQKNKLKEHVRNEAGRVTVSKMIAEIMDIFEKSGPGKNS